MSTLKEKFLNSPCELGYVNTNVHRAENNVKIAEDYAIEFAEWFINSWCLHSLSYGDITIKQSLEIFKKQKGL